MLDSLPFLSHRLKPKRELVFGLLTVIALLAFEIFNKTGAFGNSFTFLMAGVATDYTEIGLIWQNIGKKAALPILTIPQILILSYIFNLFL